MKGAVLIQANQPLRILEGIELPTLKPGQVLVRLAFSGVCHSQLMECQGLRGPDPYLPHLLGHEGSGVVVGCGGDVRKVAVGDPVVLGWIRGTGCEAGGAAYDSELGSINAGGVTTFNEMAVVSENRCVRLPANFPMDVAVLFGCALLTGGGIVKNTLRPSPGSSLAVFGAGGIGLSAIAVSQMFDCEKVIAVDIGPTKLELALRMGATHTIDASKEDPVKGVLSLTAGQGCDYAIDAAGTVKTIEQAFESVRRGGGRCVFASHPSHGSRIQIDPYELICGKKIEGSWGGESRPDHDVPEYAEQFLMGRLPLRELLSAPYALDNINEALTDLADGKSTRPLIAINPSVGGESEIKQTESAQ